MKNNDMSFESLYSAGLGLSSEALSPSIQSYEGYDGYEDGIAIELQHSIEALDFLDTYSAIENNLASAKIRMCKKLSVNYGLKSGLNATAANSVESLCRKHILSLEEAEPASDNKTDSAPEKDEAPKSNGKEKKGFFKAIFAAIGKIFKKIGEFFGMIVNKVKSFFSGKKAKQNAETAEKTITYLSSSSSSAPINNEIFNGPSASFDPTKEQKFNGQKLGEFSNLMFKIKDGVKRYQITEKSNKVANDYTSLTTPLNDMVKLINNMYKDSGVEIKQTINFSNTKNLKQLSDALKNYNGSIKVTKDSKVAQYKLIHGLLGLELLDPNVKIVVDNAGTGVGSGQNGGGSGVCKVSRQQLANMINKVLNDKTGIAVQLTKMLDMYNSKLAPVNKEIVDICDKFAIESDDTTGKGIANNFMDHKHGSNELQTGFSFSDNNERKTFICTSLKFTSSTYSMILQLLNKAIQSVNDCKSICQKILNNAKGVSMKDLANQNN